MAQFNVTELDFEKIKASIKDHFRAQSKYNDWDFDGSGLNFLLDVLAYNSHYNAMVAHFSMNEAFLDSAQIRGNVVSHAKLLGYTPRSAKAATAILDLVVTPGISPSAYGTLERGTRFSTVVDSTKYTFVTLDTLQAPLSGGVYTFAAVPIVQGVLKRQLFRVDEAISNQRFEVPESTIDTSTLRVRIKANSESADYSVYTRFSSFINVTSESQIYFLQENSSGRYEIYFGDGLLGKKPASNSIVEIEYVYTEPGMANGATSFTALDTIEGSSTISLDVTTSSYGASERESIESVRYNAPLSFVTQNRCVTADDYRAVILREVGGIETISVWGGEDSETPDYGKVYICIKPVGAETLTQAEKNNIITNVLRGKNVVSITPVMVDPTYTYIALDVFFKYNPNLTDRTKAEIESAVRQTLSDYNDDNLEKFDGVFRYSQVLRNIDSTDPAILNSFARVYMYKDITPSNTNNNYFELEYSSPIYITSGDESVITSTSFLLNGVEHFFGDSAIEGSTNRLIHIYKVVNGVQVRVVSDAGTIYPDLGKVVLSGFRPDTTDPIRIEVVPNSNDLAPKRNQLLSLNLLETTVSGDIDTIAVAGSAGTINYTTPSRHR
jgi:hypothetical protein